ncbi:MAG: leucine-rich repeat protein [Oscillospiraceae bacterium]|jgi:hypothetical protein|nr:leucine-rich repeat protein [Oscillospiraceae bacterium]
MKKKLSALILITLAITLCAAAAFAAAVPSNKLLGIVTITGSTTYNVRTTPNTDGEIIGKAAPKDKFDCLSQAESGWYEIVLPDGQVGFVSNKNAELSNAEFEFKNGVLTRYIGKGGEAVIPDSITAIDDEAFIRSVITSAVFPEGLKSIGRQSFDDSDKLTSVVLPDGLETIGDYAFYNCNLLKSIYVPESVVKIGTAALTTWNDELVIYGKPGSYAEKYCKENGIKFENAEFEIENGILISYSGKGGLVVIPNSVTSIADEAFIRAKAVTGVEFPTRLKSIGRQSFDDCDALASVVLPQGLESIGEYAFFSCELLKEIYIPASVTTIAANALSTGSDGLVVYGRAGSYAEKYCADNGIKFVLR